MFSQDVADFICERIADGKSLRELCERGVSHWIGGEMRLIPNRSTVARWLEANEDFATKYARAREMQADYMDDLILETANNCTHLTAAADRVRIDAYKWRASKLKPKVYGDKLDLNHSGRIAIPREMSEEELANIATGSGD